MQLDIYQVDAFADSIFTGNPAAVCVLSSWLDEPIMQAIASELNLSETAFLVKKGDSYRIRWFTPTSEVKLCGHATLASAHVLFEYYQQPRATILFQSLSGPLEATPEQDGSIRLNFPAQTARSVPMAASWIHALGGNPLAALEADDLIMVYSDASEIEILNPDFAAIKRMPYRGVCATAPGNGNGFDFVCRFFAPAVGIDEDPVTGSAYTKLAPYYAERTGKTEFVARQVSRRGGNLKLALHGDRVMISGDAITALTAKLHLP